MRGLWPRLRLAWIIGIATGAGLAIEGLQAVVSTGHSAELLDMAMNLVGIALALPLAVLLENRGENRGRAFSAATDPA